MITDTAENILSSLILIFAVLGIGPFLIVPLMLFTSIFCMVSMVEFIEETTELHQIDMYNVSWPRK